MSAGPLPRPERLAILGALLGIAALAWAYLWHLTLAMPGPEAMPGMPGMMMAAAAKPWTLVEGALAFAMWWAMMVGMMLPSALPMVLTFATIDRRRRERGGESVPVAIFVAGYLAVWGAFSLVATAAQWGLESVALMRPMMATTSPILGGMLFVAAGIYQFTPLKHVCLRHCRSPFDFILNRWQDGRAGAWRMGAAHGAYCLGCCWLVMLLLFVGGVMNLLWVAALAAFVLAEKVVPGGPVVARVAGAAAIAFGLWLMAPAIA